MARPATMTMPMLKRCAAPHPGGIEQRDEAGDHRRRGHQDGRRRTLAACITACIRFNHGSSCSSFATSQIRIPCGNQTDEVMRPTWE